MTPSDLEACRAILQRGSKSFFASARVLPMRVRDPATALYAFCRAVDDVIDEGDGSAGALDSVRERVARAYAGKPINAASDRAFAWVVDRFGIPRAAPDALIEGMAWDVEGRRYDAIEDTCAYAARVASTVGVMMTCVMGARGEHVMARACDLGVAMQLTNIARDVGEDARRGRVYLPEKWLRDTGLDVDAWRAKPVPRDAVAHVTKLTLAYADTIYARADAGIDALPRDCRLAIRAARLIYADIGRVIAKQGFDSVTRRASVSGPRKAWLILRALLATGTQREHLRDAPLDATRFLVEAAA